MNSSVTITIRNVETSDISIFFEQQLDLEANRMAAFVRDDPHDRAAFDAHGLQPQHILHRIESRRLVDDPFSCA